MLNKSLLPKYSVLRKSSMKVGIFANPTKADAPKALQMIIKTLSQYGVETVLDTEAAQIIGEEGSKDFFKDVDLVLSLGGDGTMLETVHRMKGNHCIPIAGINIGTLGFLTTCTDEDFPTFAKELVEDTLKSNRLSMLKVTMEDVDHDEHTFWSLNEVVLMRGNTGRLVSIEAKVNDEFLAHYKADGLIISTPTGSTAYSLSAGGPIIAPGSGVFVINPICPHKLSNRALVIPNTSKILLRACAQEDPIMFTSDGRDVLQLAPESNVEIQLAEKNLSLLQLSDSSYYEKLRVKLGWTV